MRDVSSAFRARLQLDAGEICELIDLTTLHGAFHWTTANRPLTVDSLVYDPFPGNVHEGVEESSDLGIAVIDFVMANTGDLFASLMSGGDFAMSSLQINRIFTDTPDLDRMPLYIGQIGDYAYTRREIIGQARNRWQSLAVMWPYYSYGDFCGWRFGGDGCGFNTASITLIVSSATVVTASCTQFNIAFAAGYLSNSYANGRFDFGRLTVTGGVNSGSVRTIRSHVSDILALSHPLPINSFSNMTLEIFPGCRKRRIEDCTSLYNNVRNHLGWEWIPIQENAF